jgi:hypothetical protein
MNDTLYNLARQAGFRYIPFEDIGWTGDCNDIEKFAELIIRECAEICLEANDHKNILKYFDLEKTNARN